MKRVISNRQQQREDIMLNRRHLLATAMMLALTGSTAFAQSLSSQYPELVFAKVPDETASGTAERWTPFVNYLSKQLGTKVTLRIAMTTLQSSKVSVPAISTSRCTAPRPTPAPISPAPRSSRLRSRSAALARKAINQFSPSSRKHPTGHSRTSRETIYV